MAREVHIGGGRLQITNASATGQGGADGGSAALVGAVLGKCSRADRACRRLSKHLFQKLGSAEYPQHASRSYYTATPFHKSEVGTQPCR